jgi:hypothetical protein
MRRPERSERCPYLGRKQLRLLPRGEVSALIDPVKVDQVTICPSGPALRRSIALPRNERDCPPYSQYSRPEDVALFVSQYSVTSPSTRPETSRDRSCCTSIARSLDARASRPRGRPGSPPGRSRSSGAVCPSSRHTTCSLLRGLVQRVARVLSSSNTEPGQPCLISAATRLDDGSGRGRSGCPRRRSES